MRNHLFFLLTFVFIFFNCNENSNLIDNKSEESLSISGIINNSNGAFIQVYANTYPFFDSLNTITSDIKIDGSFNLIIPKPSEDQLFSYTPVNKNYGYGVNAIDSIHILDDNLKYIRFNLFAKSNSRISHAMSLDLSNITDRTEFAKVGDYFISYYFFNFQTKIQGYYKYQIGESDSVREIVTEFNINTKKGWNKIITKFDRKDNNKAIYTVNDILNDMGDWTIGASGLFSGLWYF